MMSILRLCNALAYLLIEECYWGRGGYPTLSNISDSILPAYRACQPRAELAGADSSLGIEQVFKVGISFKT